MSLFTIVNLDLFEKKFVRDSYWLLLSQVILAFAGIIINVILTAKYGAVGFGVFSIGLKIYLLLSLFAVFGCGSSVIKYVAQYKENEIELNQLISSALILSFLTSLVVVVIAYFLSPFILDLFDLNENRILLYFLSGLPFFTLNKVLLGVLNGKRKIKLYSILQSVRWTLLLIFIVGLIYFLEAEIPEIALAFPLSELFLLIFSVIATKKDFKITFWPAKSWIKRNFIFGGQVMFSSAIIDVYTYTDVFMIGIFMNTKAVGIYAFASDISKNLLALANLIQVNLNPIISELWHKSELMKLKNYIHKVRVTTHLIYLPIVIVAVIAYALLVDYFMGDSFNESILPFIILSTGVLILSGFKAISSLPELTGFPGDNLIINFFVLIINAVLNYFLLLIMNLEGVALATSISYFSSIILLYILVKRRLLINIFN